MRLKITTLVAAFFTVLMAGAQIYYITPAVSGNPGNLNNDPESPVGSGLPSSWTTILSGNKSNPTWSSVETIPFTFEYNSAPVTQFKVSSSGVLTFDAQTAVAAPSYTNATLPNATLPDKSVMIWGLRGTGNNDNIVTKVFGTAPNRQLWVMFTSFSFASSGNNGYAYFSIVLEETSNYIYVVDQRKSGNLFLTIGTQVSSGVAYAVTGTPNVPGLAGTNSDNSDNFHYSIYPGPQPTTDAACQQILLASPIALSQAPYTLQGKFGNYGTNTLTSGTINYRVNGGSTLSFPLTGLNISNMGSATLTHPTTWNPGVGTYTVEMWLSNPNGSTDLITSNDVMTKTIVVSNNIGLDEPTVAYSMEVYPNPTHGQATLTIESATNEKAQLSVVSITGQTVYQGAMQLQSGKNAYILPTAGFATGLYLIRISVGTYTSVIKLNKL